MKAVQWMGVLTCCLATSLIAVPAKGQVDVDVQIGVDGKAGTSQVDQVYRSANIVGMEVKNAEGKSLGTINDLVIGANSGQVRYAAVSFGGFAGFGDKLFAVPCSALKLVSGEKDKYFLLNVPVEKFKESDGFDQNHWPDIASAEWAADVDRRFGVERVPKALDGRGAAHDEAYRVSMIDDLEVKNSDGKSLGHVEDVAIDLSEGKIRYAALGYGQTLGLGGKLFAIPWNLFTMHDVEDSKFLLLDVSEEQLKNAQGFDSDKWPNRADAAWSEKVKATDREEFPIPAPRTKG